MENKKIERCMAACLLLGAFFLFACGPRLIGSRMGNNGKTSDDGQSMESVTSDDSHPEESTVPATGWKVVLDAGHGAADSGKVGVNGALEKDINLSIVLFLKERLEQKGIAVMLTRESDDPLYASSDTNKKMADMKKRIAIMEEYEPHIAVSIHQNSYPDASVKGPQVFYYTGSSGGEILAKCIQESFSLAVGEENNTRQAKANGDYYLLLHTPSVCVIAECGFLSNPQEADLLVTEDYQKKIADAVAEGIAAYLEKECGS